MITEEALDCLDYVRAGMQREIKVCVKKFNKRKIFVANVSDFPIMSA